MDSASQKSKPSRRKPIFRYFSLSRSNEKVSDQSAPPSASGNVLSGSVVPAAAATKTNGFVKPKNKSKHNPPGTKCEWKRIDYLYDPKIRVWIYRDSAPFTGQETDDAYRDYCFVIKKQYDPNSSQCTTNIVIKSEILRDVCAEVIGSIPPVSFNTPQVEIDPRILLTFYPPLLTHHSTLSQKQPDDDPNSSGEDDYATALYRDNVKVEQLGLLLSFLREEYASDLERVLSHLEHEEITFDLLWALLIPQKEYYTLDSRTKQPRAVILKWATKKNALDSPYYELDCEYLESFGEPKDFYSQANPQRSRKPTQNKRFGRAKYRAYIYQFQGAVKITSLNIFPLECHPNIDEIRETLAERGKKWAQYDGVHHVAYSGIAFQYTPLNVTKRIYINGRAMVDKATFKRIKPNWPDMRAPNDTSSLEVRYDSDSDDEDAPLEGIAKQKEQVVLTDKDYVIASPIVYGFALDDKEWVEFNIDLVEPIVWNDAAFTNLVLPQNKKNLIRALVEAHSTKEGASFDDFIVGKGRGLVINLFGSPGTGKTMSAEATSEHLRKPLYVVGAGHLGTTATALDEALDEIFDIAHTWNAIVLIDEADVFLEERSVHDIHRNALVAVFLRQLEYFAGIIFLTTNRVSTFDEAFQSRIHVALRYCDLDQPTRETIWEAFLNKVDPKIMSNITEEDWKLLAEKEVNGRQIKNAVRTAQALAQTCKETLGYAHIDQVLTVMDQFEADLKNLKAS